MDRTGKLRKLSIVRRKALEQAVADAERIRKSHQVERQKLDYLQEVRVDYKARSPVRDGAQTHVPAISRHQAFSGRLDAAIGEQADRCTQIQQEVDRRKQVTLDRRKAMETLLKIIERRQAAYARRQAHQEQKTLDDLSITRHNRSGDVSS